jgi:hypothetical protein
MRAAYACQATSNVGHLRPMYSRKQRLLGRFHPPSAQRAAYNFHDVITAQHAPCCVLKPRQGIGGRIA